MYANFVHWVQFNLTLKWICGVRTSADTPNNCHIITAGFFFLKTLRVTLLCSIYWNPGWEIYSELYSWHQKKVYTWVKAKQSKVSVTRGKVKGASHPTLSFSKMRMAQFGPAHWWMWCTPTQFSFAHPLSLKYSAWQKCILSFLFKTDLDFSGPCLLEGSGKTTRI